MKHALARDEFTACANHPKRAGSIMSGIVNRSGGPLYLCDACIAQEVGGTIADVRAARRLQAELEAQPLSE